MPIIMMHQAHRSIFLWTMCYMNIKLLPLSFSLSLLLLSWELWFNDNDVDDDDDNKKEVGENY